MRFLFQMRPLEDGIFLDVGAGGHAEHFIVVTGADAASGTLPREVVLVDDLPGGDVAVGDEGAAFWRAGSSEASASMRISPIMDSVRSKFWRKSWRSL